MATKPIQFFGVGLVFVLGLSPFVGVSSAQDGKVGYLGYQYLRMPLGQKDAYTTGVVDALDAMGVKCPSPPSCPDHGRHGYPDSSQSRGEGQVGCHFYHRCDGAARLLSAIELMRIASLLVAALITVILIAGVATPVAAGPLGAMTIGEWRGFWTK